MNLPKSETFETAVTRIAQTARVFSNRLRCWWSAEFEQAKFHYIRTRAEYGDAINQYRLGLIYEQGLYGCRSDYDAHKWFLRAAFQGVADAQAKVSEYQRAGRGVPRNEEEAFKWCRKAAEQGHVPSQVRLAEMYRAGIGVERNPKEATKWQNKVATQKIPLSHTLSGELSAC